MGMNNIVFLENIEWFDETGQELVHRIPEEGSGEIKLGAQLTVRESQAGIFFYFLFKFLAGLPRCPKNLITSANIQECFVNADHFY